MPNTTAEPLTELTAFQRDAIAVVSSLERPIGLEVRDALSDVYGEKVEHGRLYPNLDTLAERGLVDKSEKDGRSNRYVLTPDGRRAMLSDLAWREYAAGFYQPSLDDVDAALEREHFDAPKVSLETCLERVVDAGLAAPLCPECKVRIKVDELRGELDEAETHECRAAEGVPA